MVEPQDSERRLPAWVPSAGVAIALAGFVAWSFAQRWAVLSASPFPLGVDGYFYPIQLRSLLETGGLQYPASPLAFWLLAPFAAATDPIIGTKLGAACFGALIALPAYGVGVHLGKSRGAGLVTASLATFSAGSAYLSIEFVKNGIGITVALTALWLVLRALETPSRARILGALVAIAAAILTHKMAAAIVIGIAIPAALAEAGGRGALRGRRMLYAIGALVLGVTSLVVLGIAAPQRFLSLGDASLLGELFSSEAEWSLPVLHAARGTLRLGYEPLIALALGVLAAGAHVVERVRRTPDRLRPGAHVVSWLVVALALVIGVPWLAVDDAQGLGMRIRIVAFVPLALCAAIVLRVALRLVVPRLVTRHERLVAGGICAVLAIGFALRVPGSRTEGRVVMEPALIASAQGLTGRIPATDTVVIPERHIAFMVAWYTRVRISIRPEPVPIEQRWRFITLAFIGKGIPLDGIGSPLDEALLAVRARSELPPILGLHPRYHNGLVLIPEPTWQYVLLLLPPSERSYFAAWPTI